MTQVLIQQAAGVQIDEIYRYTLGHWGQGQAETYINGLFESFEKLATKKIPSRLIPAEFGVEGYFFKYRKHYVYWKYLGNGDIGIAAVLHERMHQIEWFRGMEMEDAGGWGNEFGNPSPEPPEKEEKVILPEK